MSTVSTNNNNNDNDNNNDDNNNNIIINGNDKFNKLTIYTTHNLKLTVINMYMC